jgi:hypothetical protein
MNWAASDVASGFGGDLFVAAQLAGDLCRRDYLDSGSPFGSTWGLLVGAPDAFGVACWLVIENEASVGAFRGVRWLAPGRMF